MSVAQIHPVTQGAQFAPRDGFFPVTVDYRDGAQVTSVFMSRRAAERFAVEEMKWENTLSVECIPLGFKVPGDYAGFFN